MPATPVERLEATSSMVELLVSRGPTNSLDLVSLDLTGSLSGERLFHAPDRHSVVAVAVDAIKNQDTPIIQ